MTNTVKLKAVDDNGNLVEAGVNHMDIYHMLADINGLEESPNHNNHWYPKGTKYDQQGFPIQKGITSYYLTMQGFVKKGEVKDYSPRKVFTYEFIDAPNLFKDVLDGLRNPLFDIQRTDNVPRAETIVLDLQGQEYFINVEVGSILVRLPNDPALKVIRITGSQREDIMMLAKSRYNQKYAPERF